MKEDDFKNKNYTEVKIGGGGWFVLLLWWALCWGEPDLLDALIKYFSS